MPRKLTEKDEQEICTLYPELTIKQLAEKFAVNISTISRVIGKYNKRKKFIAVNHTIDELTKKELRKTLLGLGISSPNFIIQALEKDFIVKARKRKDDMIYEVTEWKEEEN